MHLDLPPGAAAANALSAMRRPAELLLLGALLAVELLIYTLDVSILYPPMNVAGPVALTSILGWSCYRIVRQSPIAVWAPLFWFRLACAAYYGFGALVPHIVNEETRQQIYSLYYFDETLNFKVNLVYQTGILGVLLFSTFLINKQRRTHLEASEHDKTKTANTMFFALLFLVAGGLLRYGLVVPYTFGLTGNVVAGMFGALSWMYYVGIYLLIVYGLRRNRKVLSIAWALIAIEIFVSVASFAKTELLLILIFSFLGFISNGASKTKIMLGSCGVVFAYFAFQPLVEYGREELMKRYGEIRGAGIGERWEIVQSYLDGSRDSAGSTQQGGLSRLSYVNVGAFVIDRYDAGLPGDTLRNAPEVLIPRALSPDKPIITQLGADLYLLIRGRHGTSLGVGHFAEAYWNFGWWGMAPFMAVLALALSIFTRFSMNVVASGKWLFLPVVFVGVNMGLRVDGHFVPDILGPAWIAICLGLALMAADLVIGTQARRKRRRTQTRFRRV